MTQDNSPPEKGIDYLDAVPWLRLTPEQRAAAAKLHATPQVAEILARQTRVSQRGQMAFAIVEHPLPTGVVAVVHIGHAAPLARYAVVSSMAFDDIVYLNVLVSALSYEMAHEDDNSPVTITIHSDNSVEYDSQTLGRSARVMNSHGAARDLSRKSGPMLKARMDVASQDIPGHGLARVVRPSAERVP